MKYRTKSCIIEAVQWTGDNLDEIKKFAGGSIGSHCLTYLYIETLDGIMKASKGDYVIKGLAGDFYPCKPDIFEKKYEEVTTNDKI